MYRVVSCLSGEHDLRLVGLAVFICLLASFVGLKLLGHARANKGEARVGWLALAGLATGCGIWATHFIGMLAYEPGVPVAYDIGLTGLSLIFAVVITGLGFSLAVSRSNSWRAAFGGAVVGIGVAAMHFTGMWALEVPGRVTWLPGLLAVSIIAGMTFATAAMVVAMSDRGRLQKLVPVLLLALSILSLHFIAMAAVTIVPDPTRAVHPFSLDAEALAIAAATAAILILGLTLAGAIADRRLRERDQRLVMAVNNMSHGVSMYNAAQRLVVCNDRYIEMYRLSPDIVKPGASLEDNRLAPPCQRIARPRRSASIPSGIPQDAGSRRGHEQLDRMCRRQNRRDDHAAAAGRLVGFHPRGYHRATARGKAHRISGASRSAHRSAQSRFVRRETGATSACGGGRINPVRCALPRP